MMQALRGIFPAFQLKDLSTYRSELMGWSILWIMMLHFRFITIKPLGFIAQYGFAGVDIFMFVSGLGLFFSLHKRPALRSFYLKRAKRIFPTYYFIGILASLLLYSDNIITYLLRYSTIGFWTNGPYFEWFIPSIVILYLLSPAIFYLMHHSPVLLWIGSILILILSYFVVRSQLLSGEHYFFFYRIPAFVGGMACGKMIHENHSPHLFLLLAILGIPFFVIFLPMHHSIYLFKYYALFFLLSTFLIIICSIGKSLGPLNVILRKVGEASLEIYLIQTLFFSAICQGMLPLSPIWHDAISLALILCCTLAGMALHILVSRIRILQ